MLIITKDQYNTWCAKDYSSLFTNLSNICPVDVNTAAAILKISKAELLFALFNNTNSFYIIPDDVEKIINLKKALNQNVNVSNVTISKATTPTTTTT